MAYCVNCGVLLNESAQKCPLCQTVVIHPNNPSGIQSRASDTLKKEIVEKSFDRSLWIKLMSITLLTPVILFLLIDWIFRQNISWSLYVSASLFFVWTWSISPFFFKRNRLLRWIPIATATLLAFLFTIEKLSGSHGWFMTIALPITGSFFGIFAWLVFLIKKKFLHELRIPSAIIFAIGVFCIFIEGAISLYSYSKVQLGWSLIVMVTCLAFGLIGLVLQQHPGIVEEIKHWFRV